MLWYCILTPVWPQSLLLIWGYLLELHHKDMVCFLWLWSPAPSTLNSPMTALGSVPKAHTQGDPEGTWNLEKLHLELKYLGRKLADAKLDKEGDTRLSGLSFWLDISLQRRGLWDLCTEKSQADTDLDCLFRFGSSAAKMCTVPWSLDTQMREASWLKLMLKRKACGMYENVFLLLVTTVEFLEILTQAADVFLLWN